MWSHFGRFLLLKRKDDFCKGLKWVLIAERTEYGLFLLDRKLKDKIANKQIIDNNLLLDYYDQCEFTQSIEKLNLLFVN